MNHHDITVGLVAPLGLAVTIAFVVTSVHRRLPPRLAARLTVWAVIAVCFAAVPTMAVVTVAYLAHVPFVGGGFEWCASAVGVHQPVSARIGLPVTALTMWSMWRAGRVLVVHRRVRCRHHVHDVEVASSDRPYAVTLPGAGGKVVVSTGLLALLDDRERDVVLAHERAHASLRHDRYLLVAALAAGLLPPLTAMATRVRYSVERWADEVAVRVCGDRAFVARTLSKVALYGQPDVVAAFNGLGVAGRVAALFDAPLPRPHRGAVVAMWLAIGAAAALSAYQLHHLERLVLALCPH